ncbi:MAG TPA: biotin/lipoyl-binding protein, partial [Anaerolineales bacterium]|nr:biotin/lipoyl-binding protein [Anaerolineales bacterium]
MKNERRFGVLALAVVLVATGCTRMTGPGAAAGGEQQTATVVMGPLTATVGATGSVRPEQLEVLSFKTTGTVDKVLVDVGDHVKKGDRLAVLRDTSLPAPVILARADLVSAQRALDDLRQSSQAAAEAQLAVANARDAVDDAQRKLTVNQEG